MHTSDIIATAPAGEYLVRIEGLRKSFGDLEVLRDVNLDVAPGEVVTIIGASGSGKSTLLNQLAGLEKPSKGRVLIGGVNISTLNEGQLAKFRQKRCLAKVIRQTLFL